MIKTFNILTLLIKIVLFSLIAYSMFTPSFQDPYSIIGENSNCNGDEKDNYYQCRNYYLYKNHIEKITIKIEAVLKDKNIEKSILVPYRGGSLEIYTSLTDFQNIPHIYQHSLVDEIGKVWCDNYMDALNSKDCNDPPETAQVKQLKHKPQQVFSFSMLGVAFDGYKTVSIR